VASFALVIIADGVTTHVNAKDDRWRFEFTQARLAPTFRIEAAAELPDVQVSINDRPVESLTKCLSVLRCYHESLTELDLQAHCARQVTRIGDVGSCPDRACVSHCQFICMRCLEVVREIGAPPVRAQLKAIAIQAEVEWCPNLRMP
jgi:hypothetical protein